MKADKPEKITGAIDGIIFHNEANGYTVFLLRMDEASETITCTGYLHEPLEGEDIAVEGSYVHNPRYGRQFSVASAERTKPKSIEGIEKYLASGVIKGIGEKTARQIVKLFGEDAFAIIENEPEKLTKIKGISLKKALQYSEVFNATKNQRQSMLFLQGMGLSPAAAMRVYKKYKEETVELVRQNPYRLADDIDGIGFKTADAIAGRAGVAYDSPFRISAGVRYCLWEAASNGHVYLPKPALLAHASRMLGVGYAPIENELRQMQIDKLIYCERAKYLEAGPSDNYETAVFLTGYYHAELTVARKLLDLAAEPTQTEIQSDIAGILSAEGGITLSDGQREAVTEAYINGVLIITGGPGTGKTTTINTIIKLLTANGKSIELAAPTGRAAKRMTEATGQEAKTLHRLLESTHTPNDSRSQAFQRNEDNPLETDVLIVDEASMVDITLMQSLLKGIAPGTRLIMVGDVNQLPSVGPGNVLKDIIAGGSVKVVRLTEIFRQSQESAIIMNAHKINRGEYPLLNERDKDFFFVKRTRHEDIQAALLELVSKRLPDYIGKETDIQILTPMRKSALGATLLNPMLQAHLNPPSADKKEREFRQIIFREGDKVMQIRNNYQMQWKIFNEDGRRADEGEGVFNGDCGIIIKINDDSEVVTVLFDDNKQVDYDFSQLDEIELAYAITIHKSQGSEYGAVVIPIHTGPEMLFNRNLLYTAITRAKKLCVIVGLPEALYRMVDNNREVERHTALWYRMKHFPGGGI